MIDLNGKKLAEEMSVKSSQMIKKVGQLCLAVCVVGDNYDSNLYVSRKLKACKEVGIETVCLRLTKDVSERELVDVVDCWNKDSKITGMIFQLPLPSHIKAFKIISLIDPRKDVDGFHPINVGRLFCGHPHLMPCTPQGVQALLNRYDISVYGKHVVIVNDSNVVGKPLAALMNMDGATVTLCNNKTENLLKITKSADILVVAVGKRPEFVLTGDMIRAGCAVVDVGINSLDGKTVGDVDYEDVSKVAGALNKVPGSVGPLTVQFLIRNIIKAAF